MNEPSGERRELAAAFIGEVVSLCAKAEGMGANEWCDKLNAIKARLAAALSDSGTGAAPPEGEREWRATWHQIRYDGPKTKDAAIWPDRAGAEADAAKLEGHPGIANVRIEWRTKAGPWTDAEEGGEADG